jgi:L-seryl-tRNA(Ser) seleniumtransferase
MKRKGQAVAVDSALRAIPSVERILSSDAFSGLSEEFGRAPVKDAVAVHLARLREMRQSWNEATAVGEVRGALAAGMSSTLVRVINATGIIIHTNLGRSPIDGALWTGAAPIVTGYTNLEFDLAAGERGKRDEHIAALGQSLFGCEDAVLTNNNAAATLLVVASVAAGREVIVSRGELVEIGGGFRVPEVIEQGGAKLSEVGTTNRTRARDYAAAITRRTAALLRVHRSNFDIVGFTETPPLDDLVEVARAKKIPVLYDEGSGRVVDLSPYGFARGDTLRDVIAKGADVVTCSTDKLIGATQGGLILGRSELIARCRRHPLMRALRAGKESYAVIGATLRAFASGKHEQAIPIYRMLATPLEELRRRARDLSAHVIESEAALGGGTTPAQTMPSVAIAVPGPANAQQERFRAQAIVGRIVNDRFTLDLRTILPEDLPRVAEALR